MTTFMFVQIHSHLYMAAMLTTSFILWHLAWIGRIKLNWPGGDGVAKLHGGGEAEGEFWRVKFSWLYHNTFRFRQSQFIFIKIAGQKTINETNVENQQRNGGKSLKYLNIFKLATSKIFLLFYVFLQFFPIFFTKSHHSNVVSIITYPPNI